MVLSQLCAYMLIELGGSGKPAPGVLAFVPQWVFETHYGVLIDIYTHILYRFFRCCHSVVVVAIRGKLENGQERREDRGARGKRQARAWCASFRSTVGWRPTVVFFLNYLFVAGRWDPRTLASVGWRPTSLITSWAMGPEDPGLCGLATHKPYTVLGGDPRTLGDGTREP